MIKLSAEPAVDGYRQSILVTMTKTNVRQLNTVFPR